MHCQCKTISEARCIRTLLALRFTVIARQCLSIHNLPLAVSLSCWLTPISFTPSDSHPDCRHEALQETKRADSILNYLYNSHSCAEQCGAASHQKCNTCNHADCHHISTVHHIYSNSNIYCTSSWTSKKLYPASKLMPKKHLIGGIVRID